MTTTALVIYGASDDLIEFSIGDLHEELGCYNTPTKFLFSREESQYASKPALVLEYGHSGKIGWHFTTSFASDHDDGDPVPEFKVFLSETGYSPEIHFELSEEWSVQCTQEGKLVWSWPPFKLETDDEES